MHFNCLIIDDEVDLAKMTCEYFQMFDISCIWTDSISGYERITREHTFDLLLLDINLQEESGFRLCKEIRETSDIPILFTIRFRIIFTFASSTLKLYGFLI